MREVALRVGARARVSLAGMTLCALALTACGAPRATPGKPLDLQAVLKMKARAVRVATVPGVPPQLGAIGFADLDHGWAGGQGALLATSDGGRTWHTSYTGNATVKSFSVLSAHQAFAATNKGLLATSDGSTWHFVDSTALESVQFFTPQTGVALRPSGRLGPIGPNGATPKGLRVLHTADGGRTWRAEPGQPLLAACFFSPQQGAAALYAPNGLTLAYTVDGGSTWSKASPVPGGYGATLTCTPDGGAWIVALGGVGMSQASYTVLRSGDYGRTWAPVLARPTAGGGPAPGNPSGVTPGPGLGPGPLAATDKEHAVMLGTCWACGSGTGTVLLDSTSDGGRSWQQVSSAIPGATPSNLTMSMPSPSLLWLMSARVTPIGAAAGDQAQVQVSSDAGRTWRAVRLFGPTTPYAVHFTSERSGYGVGWSGHAREVLATQDGGATWRAVGELPKDLAPSASYDPLAVPRKGVLYLVAASQPYDQHQALYTSSDGGRAWREVRLPSQGYGVSGISFASASLGCAAVSGPHGQRDYATRDGGRTWRAAARQGMPAAVCAASLADPGLGSLAQELIMRLAPPTRGEKYKLPPAMLTSADGGGDSLWLSFFPASLPTLQIYVLGPAARSVRVWTWPEKAPGLAGIDPVSAKVAYLWSGDGHLLCTTDGGASWRQVP